MAVSVVLVSMCITFRLAHWRDQLANESDESGEVRLESLHRNTESWFDPQLALFEQQCSAE